MVRSVRCHKEAKWCVILEAIALMSSFIPTPPFHHSLRTNATHYSSNCNTNPSFSPFPTYQCHTLLQYKPYHSVPPSLPLLSIYRLQTYKTEFYLAYHEVLFKARDTIWNKDLRNRNCSFCMIRVGVLAT